MKIRTLLLGTATAFVVGGAAQAADLAIAVEPVDYVKVCDAFGVGFYYIPGTDTCLRIRGEIEFNVVVSDKDFIDTDANLIPDQKWSVQTDGKVDFTGYTMSDIGMVGTYIKFVGKAPFVGPTTFDLDKAIATVGPVSFGKAGSVFDTGGGSNFTGDAYRGLDTSTNFVLLTYMMGTWGVFVGAEDPYYLSAATATGDYPDFVIKVTGGAGGATLGLAAKVSDQTYGTGWAASAKLAFDLGGGNKLGIGGGYADDLGQALGGAAGVGNTWTLIANGALAISGNLSLRATASYIDDGVVGATGWEGAIGPNWQITSTSEAGFDVFYKDPPAGVQRWGVQVRAKTKIAGGT